MSNRHYSTPSQGTYPGAHPGDRSHILSPTRPSPPGQAQNNHTQNGVMPPLQAVLHPTALNSTAPSQSLQTGGNDYDEAVQWARQRDQRKSGTDKDHSLFLFLVVFVVVVIVALVLWMYFRRPSTANNVAAITTAALATNGNIVDQLNDNRYHTHHQLPPPVLAPPPLSTLPQPPSFPTTTSPPSASPTSFDRYVDTATGRVLTAADFNNPNYSIIIES